MSICIVTGGFSPLNVDDLELINAAKNHSQHVHLVVGLYSDAYIWEKEGKAVSNFKDRKKILESITGVNSVIEFEKIKKIIAENDIVYHYKRCVGGKISYCFYKTLDIKFR